MLTRHAETRDFDQISAIFTEENRFHAEMQPEIIQVADPIMTHAWFDDILNDPLSALFVTEIDGTIVGVILLRENSNPDDDIYRPRRYVYVDEISVAGSHRRRGIGRRLIARAETWAREHGIDVIELNVWKANANAIAFYKKAGYTIIQHRMRRTVGIA